MSESELELNRLVRLVDGEMTPEEESLVLAECELKPEKYRTLALMLVEKQRIASALQELQLDMRQDQPFPIAKAGYVSGSHELNDASRSSASSLKWFLSLAASLVLGLSAGNLIPFLQADKLRNSPTGNVAQNSSAEPQISNADLTEEVFDPFENQQTLVSLSQTLKPDPTLDESEVQWLRSEGLQVDRYNHVFLFEMSDGNRLAIPAEFTFVSAGTQP